MFKKIFLTPIAAILELAAIASLKRTRDLKGPRVDSPCDNLFQTAIDI